MTALVLEDVSVAYGTKVAIKNIDFHVKPGEVFGLMGVNGAGKTTMIKSILGLRDQDSGSISVYGEGLSSSSSKKKISYLPEKFEPPWFLTGMEFLKFSLSVYGQPFNRDYMIEMAEMLALEKSALDRKVQTYSKGMRQKLGLMGTLLTGCSLFILDEPMSGLDPMARARVKKMILDICAGERTIFLSSHILADMDEICDRVALLHEGTLRYVGTPKELKSETKQAYLEKAFLEYLEKDKVA